MDEGKKEGLIWSKLDGGNWSKLWFSLRNNRLYYHLAPEIKDSLGFLEIFEATIDKNPVQNSYRKYLFELQLLNSEEKHLFSCLCEEDLEGWTNALIYSSQNKNLPKSPPPLIPPKLNAMQKAAFGLRSSGTIQTTSSMKKIRGFSKKILLLPLPPSLPPWEVVESIIIDPVSGEPRIATVEKLVERIYGSSMAVTKYLSYFLLTFKTFVTPTLLLKTLIEAFGKVEDTDEKTHPHRLKICIFLKKWLNESFQDFSDNPILLQQFNHFADSIDEKLASTLKRKTSISNGENSPFESDETIPLSKNSNVSFDTVDSQEMARQLTWRSSKLFRSIPSSDFLDEFWKTDKNCRLSKFLNFHEKITQWVIAEIINSGVEKRPSKYKKWIKIADELNELSNFDLTFAIMKGLQSEQVIKVKGNETWTHADVHFQAFEELKNVTNARNNYRNYREAIMKCNRQCVPWIALSLKEISDLEEDNPTKLSGGLVNFRKCVEIAKIVEDIMLKQQMRYIHPKHSDILYWISQTIQDKDGSFL